jgi:hypothetical protein
MVRQSAAPTALPLLRAIKPRSRRVLRNLNPSPPNAGSPCSDAGIMGAGALRHLDLSWAGARVTDESLLALQRSPGEGALRHLDLSGTAVSEVGLHAVVAAHPGLGSVKLESCRGVGRGVRQAAARGVGQLRAELGAVFGGGARGRLPPEERVNARR